MPVKTVGDLMHKGIIACGSSTPMDEVVRIVSDTSVHAIVVMDEGDQVLGIITHMEIIRLFGEDLAGYRARDVLSDAVFVIEADRPAKEAADLMLEQRVDRLLVVEVENGRRIPVGMLSTTDLVKEMRGVRWIWHMG